MLCPTSKPGCPTTVDRYLARLIALTLKPSVLMITAWELGSELDDGTYTG